MKEKIIALIVILCLPLLMASFEVILALKARWNKLYYGCWGPTLFVSAICAFILLSWGIYEGFQYIRPTIKLDKLKDAACILGVGRNLLEQENLERFKNI